MKFLGTLSYMKEREDSLLTESVTVQAVVLSLVHTTTHCGWRERDRDRDRDRETETDRQTDRDREAETDRETERHRESSYRSFVPLQLKTLVCAKI